MFNSFASRLTRGYVVLALVLILVVLGTSTYLALTLYARTVSDTMSATMSRAVTEASLYHERGIPFQTAAKKIVNDFADSPVLVSLVDDKGRYVSNINPRRHLDTFRNREPNYFWVTLAISFGIEPMFTKIVGGNIQVSPDWDSITSVFGWYWAIVLPVCILAVLAAWYLGRRITRRAIDPLVDVTQSLQRIAGGDFQPQLLQRDSGEFGPLIAAYNDVAYRLTAASNEREQHALQMRRFIADAGHELRTPLTIIMGYLDVLLGGVVHDADSIARIHETMLDEGRRLKALVDKLIFLARLERPEASNVATTIEVSALIQRIARGLEPIANSRIALRLPREPIYVVADETELTQAIENIIQNALKYAPDSMVTVAMAVNRNQVRVEILDRGPGMTDQDIIHAFDRFYRGSSRGNVEGSGLGLAITKRAVERAGGTILLSSMPGEGTTVIMELPTVAPGATDAFAEISPKAQPPQAPAH